LFHSGVTAPVAMQLHNVHFVSHQSTFVEIANRSCTAIWWKSAELTDRILQYLLRVNNFNKSRFRLIQSILTSSKGFYLESDFKMWKCHRLLRYSVPDLLTDAIIKVKRCL